MANDVKFAIKADSANAVQAFLRLDRAQQRAALNMSRTTRVARTQRSVLSSINQQIVGMATSALGMSTVIKMFSDFNITLEESAKLLQDVESARTRNLTITDGTKIGAERQKKQELKLSNTAGIPLEKAADIVFYVGSLSNVEEDKGKMLDVLGKTSPFLRGDDEGFAKGIGFVRNVFKDKAGSVPQIANKMFASSQVSSAGPGEFGTAVAGISSMGGAIGADIEMLMATLAYASSEDEVVHAGTELRALMKQMNKQGIKGEGLKGKFDTLKQTYTPETIQNFTDRQEAQMGFSAMYAHYDEILKLRDENSRQNEVTGTEGSIINKSIASRNADPDLKAASDLRTNKVQAENLQREIYGLDETQSDAGIQAGKVNFLNSFKKKGTSPGAFDSFSLGLREKAADFGNFEPKTAEKFVNNEMAEALVSAMDGLISALMYNADSKDGGAGVLHNPDIFNNAVTE